MKQGDEEVNLLENEELFKLLELQYAQEHFLLNRHHQELRFYWGIISALVAAFLFGIGGSSSEVDPIVLAPLPLLAIGVSHIMKNGIARSYRRFIETVAMRAQIEKALGLHLEAKAVGYDPYFKSEPFMAPRHLRDLATHHTMQGFIDNASKGGLYRVHQQLAIAMQLVATMALIGILIPIFGP